MHFCLGKIATKRLLAFFPQIGFLQMNDRLEHRSLGLDGIVALVEKCLG